MNKRLWMIGLSALTLVAGAIWWFISLDNHQQQTAQKIDELEVLNIQDERLVIGDSESPVPIVEYADIFCQYCALAHREIIPRITKDYIDTNNAYYELRLVGVIRPESAQAAHGAYCAAEQDKFWDYIDRAYKETWEDYYSQGKSADEVTIFRADEIDAFAQRAGIDVYPWRQCMKAGSYREVIDNNRQTMVNLGGYGTPFFLFNHVPYGSGTPEYAIFKSAIDAEYRKATAESDKRAKQ